MSPKVSIIIPVYNTEALLPRCLDSVLSQSLSDIEVICVDDGSTDNSSKVLAEWAARDSRMHVIRQQNGRQGKARNRAMQDAAGEYICMVDSDDYIPNDYVERLYMAAVAADADIAVCGIIKQKSIASRNVIAFAESLVEELAEKKLTLCKCPPNFHPVNKLYRRSMLERLSLRFAEGVQYEDVMFVTRALCESGRLVTVPDLSYCYVLNPQSTVKSRQTAVKQQQKYAAHRAMADYLTSRGIRLPRRYTNITVRYKEVCGICLWKIKEQGEVRTIRLFDIIPLWRYRH